MNIRVTRRKTSYPVNRPLAPVQNSLPVATKNPPISNVKFPLLTTDPLARTVFEANAQRDESIHHTLSVIPPSFEHRTYQSSRWFRMPLQKRKTSSLRYSTMLRINTRTEGNVTLSIGHLERYQLPCPMFDDVSTANILVARSIGEECLPGTRISTVAISNTLTPRVFPSISNFYPPILCLLPEAESLVLSSPFLSTAQPASLRLSTSFAPQGRKSESEIITVGSADII